MRGVVADPIFIVLVVAGCGLVLAAAGRRRAAAAATLAGLLMLYALSTAAVSSRLLALAEPPPEPWPSVLAASAALPPAERPQAIVVLSGGLQRQPAAFGGDSIGRDSLERVLYGARLARATRLPLVVSGGPVGGAGKTLAATMADVLTDDFGLTDVRLEDRSTTTEENARFSWARLSAKGLGRIYLVTDAAHIPRAAAAFRRAGFVVTPAPTVSSFPRSPPTLADLVPRTHHLDVSGRALHELAGRVAYALLYRP
jgi:uncharacterized SAM-binding protein YcdF (DUF218 family)